MLIEVTKEHIKNGIQECEVDCPIALAVCDAVIADMPDEHKHPNIITTVHDNEIGVHYHTSSDEFELMYYIEPADPDDWNFISHFIHNFDKNGDVEPFDMEFVVK